LLLQIYWYSNTENVWTPLDSSIYYVSSASVDGTVTAFLASVPGFCWTFALMQLEAPLTSSLYAQTSTAQATTTPAPPSTDRRSTDSAVSLDTGTIAGIAAGTVAVLPIIWYLFFRRGGSSISKVQQQQPGSVHAMFRRAGVPDSSETLLLLRHTENDRKGI
jgi:hypothetical protein